MNEFHPHAVWGDRPKVHLLDDRRRTISCGGQELDLLGGCQEAKLGHGVQWARGIWRQRIMRSELDARVGRGGRVGRQILPDEASETGDVIGERSRAELEWFIVV